MHRSIRFALVVLFGCFTAAAFAQDVTLIAHPSVSENTLSADDVSNILLGKKTSWSSGVIKLAVLADGPVHDNMLKAYAQRTADQFDKHWKKLVFTGKGIMPSQFKTEAELLAYVANTPGAFGYVAPGAVTGAVKAITIQ